MAIVGVQDAAHKRKVEAAKTGGQAALREPGTERDGSVTKSNSPRDLQKRLIEKI